jgi:membrane associated rhomboid family serine protease
MGISTVFALMFPWETLIVLFVPAPAIVVVAGYVAYDAYSAWKQSGGKIDSGAHLGGAVFGFGYYFLRIRSFLRIR